MGWIFGRKKPVEKIQDSGTAVAAALLNAKNAAEKTGKDEVLAEEAYNRILAALDKIRKGVQQQKAALPSIKQRIKELENHQTALSQFVVEKLDPKNRASPYNQLLKALKSLFLQEAKKELKVGKRANIDLLWKSADKRRDAAANVFNQAMNLADTIVKDAETDMKELNQVIANGEIIDNIRTNELDSGLQAAQRVLNTLQTDFKDVIKDIQNASDTILKSRDTIEDQAAEFADRFKREVTALRAAMKKRADLEKQLLALQTGATKAPDRQREAQLMKIQSDMAIMQRQIDAIKARMEAAAKD